MLCKRCRELLVRETSGDLERERAAWAWQLDASIADISRTP